MAQAHRWSVWYEDGTRCASDEYEPHKIRRYGVQVIVQADERSGRFNQCGDDVYVWKDGRWWGMDRFGMIIYLIHYPGACIVLFGTITATENFQRTLELAEADPFIPPRSAKHKGEIVP